MLRELKQKIRLYDRPSWLVAMVATTLLVVVVTMVVLAAWVLNEVFVALLPNLYAYLVFLPALLAIYLIILLRVKFQRCVARNRAGSPRG